MVGILHSEKKSKKHGKTYVKYTIKTKIIIKKDLIQVVDVIEGWMRNRNPYKDILLLLPNFVNIILLILEG